MRRLQLQLLLLAVLVLGASCAGYGQFINDPTYLHGNYQAWHHDIAYNAERNEYLLSFFEILPGDDRKVSYFRLNGSGAPIAGRTIIYDDNAGSGNTAVSYNSVNDEYLIVYTAYKAGWPGDVLYAQRVNANTGAQIGSPYCIHNCTNYDAGVDRTPSVAHSPTSNTYLVAWGNGNFKVYGRLLSGSTGQVLTGDIDITPTNSGAEPSVCWNSTANEFYVAYQAENGIYGTGWDVAGQRVNATNGSLIGSFLLMINTTNWEMSPGVDYDPTNNRYLVAYGGAGYAGVWGQFVTASNTLNGSRFSLLTAPLQGGGTRCVTYHPSVGEFLVTWGDQDSDNLYARRVSQSGSLIGDAFAINGGIGGGVGNFQPVSSANTVQGEYLLCWSYGYTTLYTRRYLPGTPPIGPVTNFVATAGTGQNALTWTNPGTPWTGTMIRFKTTGFPTGPTDGTQIYNSNGNSYNHTGLTNGVTYYYAAYAHDAVPNYAAGVNASATPDAHPGLALIPKPQELTWKTALTGFLVNGSTQIMANSSPDAKEQNMAQQLQRKVWDVTGYLPAIVYGGSTTSNVIAVGDPARCPAVNSIIATWSDATGKTARTEGYMLGIKDTSIVIRGYDNAGSFYGTQTLNLLLEYFKTARIDALFIYDYPDLPLRGSDWRIINNHDWDFSRELIREMMARYKMNVICIRDDDGTQWDSHPDLPLNDPLNPAAKADFAALLNYGANLYMKPWPWTGTGCSNTSEYATKGTLHSDLRENQSDPEDDPAESLCPLLPAAQTFMHDMNAEVLGFCPDTLFGNSPHSEYRDLRWSGCPRCTTYPNNASLLNQFIWNDYNWYQPYGKEIAIFGDMLRGDGNWPGSPTHWNTYSCVPSLPDNMTVVDWEYGSPGAVPTDYPSIDVFLSNGLGVVGMPYGFGSMPQYNQHYGDKENIYYWATALNARKATYGAKVKGLIAFNKWVAKPRQTVIASDLDRQMLGCFPYYAAWGWNVGDPYWNPYPWGNGWSMVERQMSPDRVSGFSAVRSGSNNNLSWTNPPESKFQATYIVYRTDRFPTSPIDGTYVADVAGSPSGAGSYSHVGGPSAAYYAAFAHDNVRRFSPSATSQVGVAVACFQESFSYANGGLVGQGGWTGTATSSHIAVNNGYVQVNGGSGAYQAMKAVSCNADGTGYITVTCKINGEVGVETMWNLFFDGAIDTANFARWYGTGTTVRGRIGSTASVTTVQNLSGGWEELKVKIHPANNTTEFFFNGNSIGIFDHSVTGVGDTVQNIRLERINNSAAAGQYLYFDDLIIGDVAPPDTDPPGPVTSFAATGGVGQVSLSWTNPTDGDYAGTMIRFSTAGYPGSPTGGEQAYNGTGTSTVHTGLANGVTYYYTAYAYDEVPNYSSSATVSATTQGDTTPPGPVTGFTATAENSQITLNWTNPGDADFAGTVIRFSTSGYPGSPTGGSPVYSGTGTSTVHTGLTNGVTYYYSAWAFDGVPNYSSSATASGVPVAGFCFQDEFNYTDGAALVGQGGWTGNANNTQIKCVNAFVQVYGGSPARNALKTMNCAGGPYIWVRLLAYRGTGSNTSWNVWIDDSGGKNFARWYGSGTTARGRIGSTSTVTAVKNLTGNSQWDSLVVKIDPAANTTQFYFNGEDLGVYSHGTQPGSAVGQVKIERENNGSADGEFVYLDNVRVGPN